MENLTLPWQISSGCFVLIASQLLKVKELSSRVLLCLKRALRIANAAQQMSNAARGISGSVTLFVEILNKYLYFFEKGNPRINVAAIQSPIELVTTEMQSDSSTPDPAADAFFAST